MMREKSILGSDWAYLKIYTGCRFAENCLLRDVSLILNCIINP